MLDVLIVYAKAFCQKIGLTEIHELQTILALFKNQLKINSTPFVMDQSCQFWKCSS
jgi:hypothetical protein